MKWVRLTQVIYGLCSGVSGFVSGRMVKYIPQHFITYSVLAIYLAVLLFLLSWEPAPVHYVLLMVPAIFGACEGAIFCIAASELIRNLSTKMIVFSLFIFIAILLM